MNDDALIYPFSCQEVDEYNKFNVYTTEYEIS